MHVRVTDVLDSVGHGRAPEHVAGFPDTLRHMPVGRGDSDPAVIEAVDDPFRMRMQRLLLSWPEPVFKHPHLVVLEQDAVILWTLLHRVLVGRRFGCNSGRDACDCATDGDSDNDIPQRTHLIVSFIASRPLLPRGPTLRFRRALL